MGYSTPINTKLSLEKLKKNLFSIPSKPDAIPYVTSYYQKNWGFCIKEKEKKKLKPGKYNVLIKSKFKKGYLNYGELIIPGKIKKEVFLSTYICHPSMANNEISGPVVTTELAKWLTKNNNKYTYRIIFIPETIGSIAYLSKNLNILKKRVIAGFNVTCVGDNRAYSFLPSRNGNTISDKAAQHVLKWTDKNYKSFGWEARGSDERQYCAPKVDLPIASIMRTKFNEYPEYHTSLDTLGKVVTEKGLQGGFEVIQKAILAIENDFYPKSTTFCEPQLSKRDLYPSISNISNNQTMKEIKLLMDFISWSDGTNSLIDIAEKCSVPVWELYPIVKVLKKNNLITS